ncbi:MAG: acyl carrier protein [Bacteroidales bacterium]|nr:acyl carrier protein [Bacteroidales bacterium]
MSYDSENDDVEEVVKAIIVEKLGVEEYEITYDASFVDDLGADSLDSVELIMEFEKAFGVEFTESKVDNIQTVGDVISYIKSNSR